MTKNIYLPKYRLYANSRTKINHVRKKQLAYTYWQRIKIKNGVHNIHIKTSLCSQFIYLSPFLLFLSKATTFLFLLHLPHPFNVKASEKRKEETMSSSIMKTLQIRKPASLPVSSTTTADANEPGLLRRRLSSLSLNLSRNQPSTDDLHRSKSVSAMGEQRGSSSVKEWWEWSWSLILLKKLPVFFTDLEFNEKQTKSSLGNQQRGGFAQVFFRLRSEIRRLLRTSSSDSLPLSCNR